MKIFRGSVLVLTVCLFACRQNPFDRTQDVSGSGPAGPIGQSGTYMIFNNELVSGGGLFFYPGGEHQTITLADRSNPISQRSIRYHWTGEPVSNVGCAPDPTFNFAGFNLMHAPLLSQYASMPAKNLSGSGYTKVTFYARGNLSTNTLLKIEVASRPNAVNACLGVVSPCVVLSTSGTDSDPQSLSCSLGRLSPDWQSYSIPVPPAELASVKDFFKATFVFINPFVGNQQPGQGGTVYFDRIVYEP